jgi:hypothetical protein
MTEQLNITVAQGAEFQTTITIASWPIDYPPLANAVEWRLTVSQPDAIAFLTASSLGGSPMIVLNGAKTVGTITIPSAVTAAFPLGAARYDFEIRWAGNVVKRLISLGSFQVNTYAGAV